MARTKATTKKTVTSTGKKAKVSAGVTQHQLKLIKSDVYLEPFTEAINGRYQAYLDKKVQLVGEKGSLNDFASGYLYFGLHKIDDTWVLREWAPNAIDIFVVGDFNDWKESAKYAMKRLKGTGNWELKIKNKNFRHGTHFKLIIHWEGGCGERIPAWANRVVQDPETHLFSAQVWDPEEKYVWAHPKFKPDTDPLLIYECHIGMGQNAERVGTYTEFRDNVLPRVAKLGYNCIQIMAIQEHPYYGSFGYHVSSFFAASSRNARGIEIFN